MFRDRRDRPGGQAGDGGGPEACDQDGPATSARAAVGITMLLVFTVGLEGGRARSLVVGALMALLVPAVVFITGQRPGPTDVIAYASLVLGALLAGEALRARQALQRALAEEAARAREAAAQHRFDSERLALPRATRRHRAHAGGHQRAGLSRRAP
jgi:hypothetical protein